MNQIIRQDFQKCMRRNDSCFCESREEYPLHFPPKMFTEDTLLAAMETAGNKEFDSETEKRDLGHRQPELILLRNWYLPGMQNVKENRFFLRRQAVS